MLVPFSPKPGLNSDDTTFSAEGRWADGNNVRFVDGKPQVKGGADSLFTVSITSSVCRSILPFARGGSTSIAYGVANLGAGSGTAKLYVGSGLSSPIDRTPASLGTSIFNWSFAPWGDTLLAVPEGGTLYEQSGSGTASAVANAPDEITYMLVTPERQVLALGCSEEGSGIFNGLCIRGCDTEDYTDWTTSSTNNAFEHILEGGGKIVAGRMIGQYVAIWTTSALYLGQFLGNPGQTYRFDRVGENCGLAGPNAVVIHDQVAYWIGPDLRPRMWSIGALPQIMQCPIWRHFASTQLLPFARYITASSNARFNEIRFDVRGSDGYPAGAIENRYISVCLHDGSWHRGRGGYTAIVESGLLASLTTAFDDGPTIIASSGATGINAYILETGLLEWAGGSDNGMIPYIQSADHYLDNSQRRMMIRSIIPEFEDQSGSVSATVLVRDRPQATATTKGPYILTTATTKKDFRASGKIVAVKFHATQIGSTDAGSSFFRLGKPLFDVVPMGER